MTGDTILVVDDYKDNLNLVRLVLTRGGHDVKTASDAEEAMQVLKSVRPKLILMDIQLPGVDGLELTRRLKADPAMQATIIVAFTAYAMKGDEDRFRAAGCDGYICKPINTLTLNDEIQVYLDRAPLAC
jgi:CheY-like chemotaxis protein